MILIVASVSLPEQHLVVFPAEHLEEWGDGGRPARAFALTSALALAVCVMMLWI